MIITKTFTAADRLAWHAWLVEHGASEIEVWLVYYKKHTGKPTISYIDSLEEALCFGWVDSLIQKIDDEKYARKFTPRKTGSEWSEVNWRLVAKLIHEGLMTEAGLAKVSFPVPGMGASSPHAAGLPFPDWLKTALMNNPLAWVNFEKLPASHQRRYIAWISDAKREGTRQKRIQEAILLLEENKRLGIGPGEVRK